MALKIGTYGTKNRHLGTKNRHLGTKNRHLGTKNRHLWQLWHNKICIIMLKYSYF